MMTLDPLSLRSFVQSSPRVFSIYESSRSSIWRTLIYRDFGQAFSLLQVPDFLSSLERPFSGETYLKCVRKLVERLWQCVANPKQPTVSPTDLIQAIRLMLQINPILLRRAKSVQYLQIAKFLVANAPELLESIVRITPDNWFISQDGTDYTWVVIFELKTCTEVEKQNAIPYIVHLFADPRHFNPTGYLNRNYSDTTRSLLEELLRTLPRD